MRRLVKVWSKFLPLALLASLLIGVSVPSKATSANTACAVGAAAQNSIEVEPSHGKVFYIDTGVSPRLDATYVGYRVKNTTGSTIENGWVSLTNFVGGAVNLSRTADQYAQLPSIPNNQTRTVYFLLKASISTKVAQTHTVKVWRGRPDVSGSTNPYTCDFSFTKVAETIKAAANKVTAVSVSDSTPELGQLITITAQGATGTIGAGSADVGRILWFSPSAFSNFPTAAIRLESVKLVIGDNNNFNNSTDVRIYDDRLLVDTTTSPNSSGTVSYTIKNVLSTTDNLVGKRYYKNEYSFRVIGTSTAGVPVQPVAQISSGTQIKHTDISQTPSASIATNNVTINLNTTKNAAVPSPAVTTTLNSINYQQVNYTITVDNTAASGNVTVDEIVDTPANGVVLKTGSVQVNGSSYADPVRLSSEANLSPQPYHFVGPFQVASNTNLVITYSMWIPTASNATFTNKAASYVGSLAVGASSSTVSNVAVTVNGGSVTQVVVTNVSIDPVPVTLPATSIGTTTATLNGTVDGNAQTPSAVFEWSTNSTLSSYTTISASNSVAGSDPTAITSAFTGTSGTTYFYRIVAIKNATRFVGEIQSFTLVEPAAAAVAVTQNASNVLSTSAYLNGSIDPNMQTITQVRFRYGTDANLNGSTTKILYELTEDGAETTTAIQLTGANPIDLQWQLTGLTQGTTYYYRIEGDYTSGTAQTALGSIVAFKPGSQSQTINFSAINDQTFSTGSFDINATASSNLNVTYRSESTSVCTVNASTGVVTFVRAGLCAITASQSGDNTYAAADDVTRQFEIIASAPTATTNAASNVTGTTAVLNGAITVGGADSTTVTFTYSVNSDLTGGTTVSASQSPISGNASVTYSLTGLTAGTQYFFKVIAQNSHSTVSGNILNFTTTVPTAASVTAENKSKNYAENTPAFTFTTSGLVNPDSISSVTYTFAKTNGDGYAAYGPSTTPPTNAGVYSITPSAAVFGTGNAGDYTITYNAGTYTINKINQAALSLSGASISQNTTVNLNATGGSGTGAVSYAVTSGTCTIAGNVLSSKAINETCVVEVTKALDQNYNVQTTTANFVVNSNLAQTITFADPADRELSATPFNVTATASSTLTVTLTSGTPNVCTVATTADATVFAVTMLAAGTCTLTASQAGGIANNNTYNAANNVTQSFEITAPPSATTNNPSNINKNAATLNGAANRNLNSPKFCVKAANFADATACKTGGGNQVDAQGDGNGYSFGLTNLNPSTTYYYVLFGNVGNNEYAGTVKSFKTRPNVLTNPGSSVSARAATLNARVSEPLTTPRFCYKATQFATLAECTNNGTIADAGNPTQALVISNFATLARAVRDFVVYSDNNVDTPAPSDALTEVTYALPVSGLSPNTVYYFIIYGTVDNAEYDGGVQNFTTPADSGGGGGGGGLSAPVTPPPAINSLSQLAVCAISNDITIVGSNLDGAVVKLDGITLVIKSATSNSLVVTLPTGELGNKVLTITTSAGTATANINYVTASKPKFQPVRIPYLSQGIAINLDFVADHSTRFRLVGKLPSGVVFNNETGLMSGTPTENGVFVFNLVAVGPCGETMTVVELDVDAPTPIAISHRINFLPGSCELTDSAKASFEAFITKVKGISPRNIIPDIYISGGSKNSDPNSPIATCRQDALCDLLLIEDLTGDVLTDVFSGSENRIEIIVYWPRPNDDL